MSTHVSTGRPGRRAAFWLLFAVLWCAPGAAAQDNLSVKGKELYEQLKAATLSGDAAEVKGWSLKRDRAEMTFDGVFYFTPPIEGQVTGAVFIGQGNFRAEAPPSKFERENLKRLVGATDAIASDFRTAVFRFTDDTYAPLAAYRKAVTPNPEAQKLITELDKRILKETGANLPARLALSLLNGEKPGFFFAQFDGGRRERFSYLLDWQSRIPAANFVLNAGEKGLLFKYNRDIFGNDIWMAFYSLADYERNQVEYSDLQNLVDVTNYQMHADLRDPGSRLGLLSKITMQARAPNLRAVSFQIGESLGEYDNQRQRKQMRLKSAQMGGAELAAAQEDWEGGFTIFLPRAAQAGDQLELALELAGDFMIGSDLVRDCFYPASNSDWYPRHGYLDRATFDLTFRHRNNRRIASVGQRLAENADPEDKELLLTRYALNQPVPLATFAYGPFQRHAKTVTLEKTGTPLTLEFNSLPGSYAAIKEDFILAELDNSVRYFSQLFGPYPYPAFNAAVHPFGFGQGFASILMIPPADRANKRTYAFIAHETAHQWWGNIVAWRSYRDQWLSEGFAEYSGALYTGLRDSINGRNDLLNDMRRELKDPPITIDGPGKGRLNDVGPIILGHRLSTRKTLGAYQTLIYGKGALALRMLHFLFTNPSSGEGQAFFDMMSDFVNRHRDGFASTDDFRLVANEHFARTPIAQKYRLKDLNWFFNQWVYQSGLPSYQLEYQFQDQPDGSVLVTGNILQENVTEDWLMILPLAFDFGDKRSATGTVHAYGPKTPFTIKLPMRPKKVELDPYRWVLSEKTSIKGG
jgi:hypothetical protein